MSTNSNLLVSGLLAITVISVGTYDSSVRYRTRYDLRLLTPTTVRSLVGGACSTQCYNWCSTNGCQGSCAGHNDGESCPGGNPGQTGLAMHCTFGSSTQSCVLGTLNPTNCTPTKVCRCLASQCGPAESTGQVNGDKDCTTGTCGT